MTDDQVTRIFGLALVGLFMVALAFNAIAIAGDGQRAAAPVATETAKAL